LSREAGEDGTADALAIFAFFARKLFFALAKIQESK
jgi:hypothetical protein